LNRVLAVLLIIFLAGCSYLPCKRDVPPLQLEYGFIDCGVKKVAHESKIKEYKVYCLTEEDKSTLEVWMIFWCQ